MSKREFLKLCDVTTTHVMTGAVSAARLTGQMIMKGSPVGTGRRAFAICEADRTWRNTSPYGAPQLGRRGLYRAVGMHCQAVEMGLLVDVDANPGSTSLVTGEAS